MKAKIRDTEIFFDVDGAQFVPEGNSLRERPVAFVLHGGPGIDHSTYKPSLTPLTEHMQLIYVDHRGQGRSARGDKETYTLENNVEDLEALRQYLGLDKVVVIGASYGGMVAMSYACTYPNNVSHLIALVTAPSYQFMDRAREILAQRGSPEQIAIAEKLWQGAFKDEQELTDFFTLLAPIYSVKYDASKAQAKRYRGILSVDAINKGFGDCLRGYDIREKLQFVKAQTLVIGARQDWICAAEFSEEIARLIPNAELFIYGRSGHSILQDANERVLADISRFVLGQMRKMA